LRLRPERLDIEACLHLEPALAQSRDMFVGGLYYAQDETGDSHAFSRELAAAAERLGADFRYGVTVQRLLREGDAVLGAETDKGPIRADATVLSLGCGSQRLLRALGIRVPIYPVKGYSATMPSAGPPGAPTIGIHDRSRKIGITPLGDRLRAAGTAEFAGYDNALRPERAQSVLRNMMTIFPQAGDASRAELWSGLRPMTPDCVPLIGHTRLRNLYLDTGHGSLGWTLACGSGRVIADLVSGREPDVDLAGLTIARY
jgi:D-amino-acid dehydrogenase